MSGRDDPDTKPCRLTIRNHRFRIEESYDIPYSDMQTLIEMHSRGETFPLLEEEGIYGRVTHVGVTIGYDFRFDTLIYLTIADWRSYDD